MKSVLLSLLLSSLSFATSVAPNFEAIYKALNVQEVNVTPQGLAGSTLKTKTAGELFCQSKRVVYPGAKPTYVCTLRPGNRHHDEIYEALNIKEQRTSGRGYGGGATYRKSTGGFVCIKTVKSAGGYKTNVRCHFFL